MRSPDARLAEAAGLARAIALDVVHAEVIKLRSATASTLFGKGQIERLAAAVAAKANNAPPRAVGIASALAAAAATRAAADVVVAEFFVYPS
jgi:hypothetical protein